MVHPGIHFKAVEDDTLPADPELGQGRAHLPVKPVAVHAKVGGGITESDQARLDLHLLPAQVDRGDLFPHMAQLLADGQPGMLICRLLRPGQILFSRSARMGRCPTGELQVSLLGIGVAQAVHFR